MSASPGMTRMRPKTISDESSRTGTASSRRRITYFCMAVPCPLLSGPRLFVHPGPRQGRRTVAVAAAQRAGGRVAHVRLEDQEAVVVRHPQPERLIELALDDLLGQIALLGLVGRLPDLRRQLIDDWVVDAEEVLRRLRMHVLIGPLVEADRVPGLEAPGHPVPLAVDVAAVVGRVVELLDLDVDVQVLLEVRLHELHLRAHLREVLVVENRRLEALAVSGLGHELLGLVGTVLPPGTELLQGRRLVLVVDVRQAPAWNPVALEDRVDLL